ncbi:Alpha/Beta hydrolase fold [Elaphomyces granulatus]
MAITQEASLDSKFKDFTIIQAEYKRVGSHGIRADIMIPKTVSPGKRPVIIRFHGGFLGEKTYKFQLFGDSLFGDWFSRWLIELAERQSAIIISANYRLLPESTGLEILDDFDDFWSWIHSSDLANILASQPSSLELDLSRIIATGESAGGLPSIHLALSHPDEIRAVLVTYPMLDLGSPFFASPKNTPGALAQGSAVTERLQNIKCDDVVSTAVAPERMSLMTLVLLEGKFAELYTRGSENSPNRDLLFPIDRLNKEDKLPRGGVVILHGADDDVVPVEGSENFIKKAKEVMKDKQGGDKLVLTVQPGGHGFDVLASLDDQWLSQALQAAVETWLE